MKPYILDDKKWNSLNTFKTTLDIVRDKNIPRSKIKELRSIYRQGKDKTKMYMEMNGLERAGRLENKLDYIDNFRCEFGFNDDYAVFNDAIEIMDFIEEV